MSKVLQLPQQPNMLSLLNQGQPEDDGRLARIVQNITASRPPTADMTQLAPDVPASTPSGPPIPSESAQLSSQLSKLNAPPTGREAALKAILAFAPTAIAGAVGGLPAAEGAAQGTNQAFTAEAAQKEKQRESLVSQVQAARQREQQASEFGQTLGLHKEQIGAENQRNLATVTGENTRNANTIAAENARAEATRQAEMDRLKYGNSPESQAAKIDLIKQESAIPNRPTPVQPMAGRDFPLPDAVATQREAIAKASKNPPQEATVVIRTTDANGNPVTEIVPKKAGSSFAAAPTQQQQNVANQAKLVHEQTPYMLAEIDRLKDKVGPLSGRWNEFMQGKIGMNDPDMAGLRADLLMYSSAVALMHARGRLPENLREEFDKAINNPGQTSQNLKTIITKIDSWAVKNPGVGNSGGDQPKTVNSKAEYDALPSGAIYMEDGKQFRKP
jgi:hypothetical protein